MEARPTVLVSATAVGYYGTSETGVFDENRLIISQRDFNPTLAKKPAGLVKCALVYLGLQRMGRNRTKKANKDVRVRVTLIRIGVVLRKDVGALAMMIPFFQMFAGGPLGTGHQW